VAPDEQAESRRTAEVDFPADKLTQLRVMLIIIGIWNHLCACSKATMTQIEYSALDDQSLIRLIVQARAEALSELCGRLVFSSDLSWV
jgi:hypothetical protein